MTVRLPVIAQQYSFAANVALRFHFRNKISARLSETLLYRFFFYSLLKIA
jgi:hypothetical protein